MIAFKSRENHCVGKLQYVLSDILAITSRSEDDINAFEATRKLKALNKLLLPEDVHEENENLASFSSLIAVPSAA